MTKKSPLRLADNGQWFFFVQLVSQSNEFPKVEAHPFSHLQQELPKECKQARQKSIDLIDGVSSLYLKKCSRCNENKLSSIEYMIYDFENKCRK